MTFTESIKTCYTKYATFKGRASRSEYWWFLLFGIVLNFVILTVFSTLFNIQLEQPIQLSTGQFVFTMAAVIYGQIKIVFLGIPGTAAMVRRLHDTGRSGWWFFIIFTIIGAFFFIYWLAKASDTSRNKYDL